MDLNFVLKNFFLFRVKAILGYHFDSTLSSSRLVDAKSHLGKCADSNDLANPVEVSDIAMVLQNKVVWLNQNIINVTDDLFIAAATFFVTKGKTFELLVTGVRIQLSSKTFRLIIDRLCNVKNNHMLLLFNDLVDDFEEAVLMQNDSAIGRGSNLPSMVEDQHAEDLFLLGVKHIKVLEVIVYFIERGKWPSMVLDDKLSNLLHLMLVHLCPHFLQLALCLALICARF